MADLKAPIIVDNKSCADIIYAECDSLSESYCRGSEWTSDWKSGDARFYIILPHYDIIWSLQQKTQRFGLRLFARIAVVPEFCSSFLFPEIMGPAGSSE